MQAYFLLVDIFMAELLLLFTVNSPIFALVALTGSSFAPDGAKTAHYGGVPASQVRPVYTNSSLHASMTQLLVYTGQL